MSFFLTLQSVSVLFSLILIGFISGKLKIISPLGQKELTKFVLYVTMPATIITAMQVPFSKSKLNEILVLLLIFIGSYAVIFLIASIVSKFFNAGLAQKNIYKTSLLLTNTSFMGYPIVKTLMPEGSLFFAVMCGGLVFEIISWTLGTYIIGRNAMKQERMDIKKAVLNPGVISIMIGSVLFFTNTSIPQPLISTMNLLSGATSPLAMVIVGLILSQSKIGDAFTNIKIYVVCIFKLVINPLILLFVLKFLNFEGKFLQLPVIMLSLPTAAYVAIFSDLLGNDKDLAGQIVFISSLFSLITIPIILSIAL